jgi:regulator of sigma E protease
LNGKENPTWEDVELKEIESAYRGLPVTVERSGRRFDTTVTPTLSERTGVGYAGWDERGRIQVGEADPNLPAFKTGLRKGDVLLAVNGEPIHSQFKLYEITKNSNGRPVTIDFERNGEKRQITVQPVLTKLNGPEQWMIGVIPQQKLTLITTKLSLPDAFRESVRQNQKGALLIVTFLKGVVERRMSPKNIAGPIGIGQLAGEAGREGASAFLMLMSMISLNLAIVNLLPIPIMDGGVIVMLLVEMTMQRDLSLTVKEAVFKVGFVCIMVILAFVIYNDISKLLPAG